MNLTCFHPGPSNAKVNTSWWDTATLPFHHLKQKFILELLSPRFFNRHHCCLLQNVRLSFEPLSKGFPYNFSWCLLFQSQWTSRSDNLQFFSQSFLFNRARSKRAFAMQNTCYFSPFLRESQTSDQFAPWAKFYGFYEKLCHCCGA